MYLAGNAVALVADVAFETAQIDMAGSRNLAVGASRGSAAEPDVDGRSVGSPEVRQSQQQGMIWNSKQLSQPFRVVFAAAEPAAPEHHSLSGAPGWY